MNGLRPETKICFHVKVHSELKKAEIPSGGAPNPHTTHLSSKSLLQTLGGGKPVKTELPAV